MVFIIISLRKMEDYKNFIFGTFQSIISLKSPFLYFLYAYFFQRMLPKVFVIFIIGIYFIINLMGQGLACCECIYTSTCFDCTGLSINLFCCGCWACMPPVLEHLRGSGCCQCYCNQGYGSSCFCCSYYCCIPDYLRLYSIWQSIGNTVGQIYDTNINKVAVVQRQMRPIGSARNLY